MATKATVYKAQLNVADLDRGYYADHALTLACHPSETTERLMLRVLAFALYASESLAFGRGISSDDEPDLWEKDLTGDIRLWIELGQPDDARIRKACNRAARVVVISYGARAPEPWWEKVRGHLTRFRNLSVLRMPADVSETLADRLDRSMDWQVTLQDGNALVTIDGIGIEVTPETWQQPDT